jgi:antitoxin component YwqK of YwqJK toxin-antitoxin module
VCFGTVSTRAELVEERHTPWRPWRLKARGCVSKDAQGNYCRQGRWEFWYPRGAKYAEGDYEDAYVGGEKSSTGILRDGREGRWVYWYERGQKHSEYTYRDGKPEGVCVTWHKNGQKSREGTFRDGKQEGVRVAWHENGQKTPK